MRTPRAWLIYLLGGLVVTVLYLFVAPFKGSGPVFNLLGLSPMVAIAYGVRLHRPASRRPWWFFLAGFALFWLGDLYTYSYPKLLHSEVPFPSPGDGLYLLVYPVLIAGLLMLVRRRHAGGDRGGLIDTAILTLGLSLPSWVGLMAPYLHDHQLGVIGKLVSVAYPTGDVLLLAVAIRLALDQGRREPAFYLLGASIVWLLATDFVYGLLTLGGTYDHQLWLDLGWIAFYLLWGAAALHPSMVRLQERGPLRNTGLTGWRLALLTVGSLIAPVIALARDIGHGDSDMAVVQVGALVLFGLVVTRMAGLVRATASLSEEVHRRRSEARFGSLVKHSSDLITVVAPDGVVTYQSPSIEHVLGWTADEITGTRFDALMEAADRRLLQAGHAFDCTLAHRSGPRRHFEIRCTDLTHDEDVGGLVLNARDVSDRRVFEEQLTHQAFHDPVTGLANRAMFVERVRHALAQAHRENRTAAVVFLDLDDFKTINDSLGHAAGDEVLAEVAKRLAASIRASDTAARFGGDEFALLLEDVQGVQEAADTAERIIEALAVPLVAGHRQLSLHGSLGISLADGASVTSADELIRDADAAMYIAKREGKSGYRLFEPEMHEHVLSRLELRTDLQRALVTDQLELHYQPVVHLSDGSVAGVEALLRWRHPERGLVPPDAFIPLAEETGLIIPIGRWVLREGCRNARRILGAMDGTTPPSLSINLSLRQLQHSDIVADVREALAEFELPPACLTLEITETVLMADSDLAVARLTELKDLGVRLALDDFGTGYSSLSYLSRFPVDILKMDRSFLHESASAAPVDLTPAVLALGATLGIEVVAEGIELAEQWETLRELGCTLGQGFYFARPMDADATLDFLAHQRELGTVAGAAFGADAA